ncbi:MAG: IS21 family transposase [Proteobacteria bacterium]|nr:IS21 family transposase [Pseudomonadota bacterium]
MANQLKMATVETIWTLKERGWSQRRIAKELDINRETVARYLKSQPPDSKPATNAPTGSLDAKPANAPIGSTTQPPIQSGPKSQCEPWHQQINEKLEHGLSCQRIYQDLRDEYDFQGSYYSVRRYANRLEKTAPIPFRRMECLPGEEAQIDFGTGAPVLTSEGTRKRSHVFRIVLSYSRKGYSESVFRQTTDNFLGCIEDAFWHFGGVPKTLVIDNLKAAVKRADWYDPDIHPKILSFCEHYNTVILPTKPYTPRHKGKVERGIGYVKGNALKGRTFTSLQEQNQHLLNWETRIADTRIHGTTRHQVGQVFRQEEKTCLLSLPSGRFPCFQEAKRSVHRDGHIEVKKAYYSVPPEYTGRTVWARWDGHLVRVYNTRMEQIALHVQVEPGAFQTQDKHIHSQKRTIVERGTIRLLRQAAVIGSNVDLWAQAMIKARGIQGVRVLVGLLNLANKIEDKHIDKACEVALTHEAFRLKTIKQLIERGGSKQQEIPFIDEHPIIRDLSDYGDLVKSSLK